MTRGGGEAQQASLFQHPTLRDHVAAVLRDVDEQCGFRSVLARRWAQFHTAHPEVLRVLVALAREEMDAGHARFGVSALFEKARWQLSLDASDGRFRLNNSFRSFYSRLIAKAHPELARMFTMRRLGLKDGGHVG